MKNCALHIENGLAKFEPGRGWLQHSTASRGQITCQLGQVAGGC